LKIENLELKPVNLSFELRAFTQGLFLVVVAVTWLVRKSGVGESGVAPCRSGYETTPLFFGRSTRRGSIVLARLGRILPLPTRSTARLLLALKKPSEPPLNAIKVIVFYTAPITDLSRCSLLLF